MDGPPSKKVASPVRLATCGQRWSRCDYYRRGGHIDGDGGDERGVIGPRQVEPCSGQHRPKAGPDYGDGVADASDRAYVPAPEVARPQEFAERDRAAEAEAVQEEAEEENRPLSCRPPRLSSARRRWTR